MIPWRGSKTSTDIFVRYLHGGKYERQAHRGRDFSQTGYSYTLSLIAGKYKPVILYCLMEYEPVRFNQMQRYLGRIADKTLSATLKELERDGLIHREMYPEIPPKVEYTLTERGHSLMRVLDQLCTWGSKTGREAAPPKIVCPACAFSGARRDSDLCRKKGGPSMVLSYQPPVDCR